MNIYFCQSSTDLLKILYLTKINKNNNCLICVNVNGCYDLALNLNNKFNIFDKCLLIKSKLDNPYNLFNWLSEYFNIIKIKNQLNKSSSSKIYFFSEYFDLLTFSVIKKIKNPIDIYVENNPETNKFIEIQNSFKSKLMSFLYGIKVSNYDYKGLKVFGINKSFYKKVLKKIPLITFSKVFKKTSTYLFPLPCNSIILLDSNDDIYEKMIDNFSNKFLKLYKILSKYDVYLKSHPRMGPSVLSQKFNFKSLDSNIPLEFYKFKNNIVIGIDSISLANISSLNSKVVSLSKLLDNNHSFYNRTKEYLDYFAEGEVLYPNSIQDLINILNEKNTIQ